MVVANLNNTDGLIRFTLMHMFTTNFSADDGVIYQCLAVNDNGPNSDNVTIIVQGELSYTIESSSYIPMTTLVVSYDKKFS